MPTNHENDPTNLIAQERSRTRRFVAGALGYMVLLITATGLASAAGWMDWATDWFVGR